jgi:hypothetical protein
MSELLIAYCIVAVLTFILITYDNWDAGRDITVVELCCTILLAVVPIMNVVTLVMIVGAIILRKGSSLVVIKGRQK